MTGESTDDAEREPTLEDHEERLQRIEMALSVFAVVFAVPRIESPGEGDDGRAGTA